MNYFSGYFVSIYLKSLYTLLEEFGSLARLL